MDSSAFLLATLLDQYERDADELASKPLDRGLYARVNRQLREMRLLCAGVRPLAAPWVHLLISHAELMHCLWARPRGETAVRRVEHCKAHHLAAIRALRQKRLLHLCA